MHPLPHTSPSATEPSRCPYQRASETGESRRCALPADASHDTVCPHARRADGADSSPLPPGALVLVGVNHHTAPVELRERFYQGGELSGMLDDLRRVGLAEAAVLFTCNRFEVYGAVGAAGADAIIEYVAARCGMPVHELLPSLYRAEGSDAALHLMRVAAGLESLVLGEPQILGQVSDALAYAQANDAIGPILTRLFTSAVHAGKRARTETGIGRHTLSISHAAVLLLKGACDLSSARVLVVGAGEMATLAVGALQSHGAGSVRVVNRTFARASDMADRFGIAALPWDQLPALLHDCDAVIVATGSATPLITSTDVGQHTDARPLQMIDLSVPRNIDEACGTLPGIRLHDVDDLQQVVETHRIQRQRQATRVEELLEAELADYLDWVHSRAVTPLISDLRRQATAVVEAEIEATLRRLPQLDEAGQAIVAQMAHRIVGKLLHPPTMALKSRTTAAEFAHAVRRLFGLDVNDERDEAELPAADGRDG